MRVQFKTYDEKKSPNEGGGVFKIYDEPELPSEGSCLTCMTNRNHQVRGRV